jgi:hypothetical protein
VTPRRLRLALAAAVVLAACGRKGPPLVPLRPVPEAVADLGAVRRASSVTIQFTVPAANLDGSRPGAAEGVEVYAWTRPAAAPPPAAEEVMREGIRVWNVEVRREARRPAPPGASPDLRPGSGDAVSQVEQVETSAVPEAAVRYYAVSALSGRRRGPWDLVAVPLAGAPAPPEGVSSEYTETTLTLSWSPASGRRFLVESVAGVGGAEAGSVLAGPQDEATYTTPVEIGRRRCYAVRAVQRAGRASIEGPLSAPHCVEPVDRLRRRLRRLARRRRGWHTAGAHAGACRVHDLSR